MFSLGFNCSSPVATPVAPYRSICPSDILDSYSTPSTTSCHSGARPLMPPLAYFLASLRFRPHPPLTFMLVCLPHHALVFFSIQPSPMHVSGSGPFCLSHPGYPQLCDTPAIHSVCLNPQAAEYMKIQLVVRILVSSISVVSGPDASHLSWVFGAMYNILMNFSSVPLHFPFSQVALPNGHDSPGAFFPASNRCLLWHLLYLLID